MTVNEEVWKYCRPIEGLEDNYYLVSVQNYHKHLGFLLKGRDNKQQGIEIVFEYAYEAYRCIDEGARYKTLCNLTDRYGESFIGDNCLFIVENSQFVAWLIDESRDVLEEKDLIHFVFLTIDSYVDVVAGCHPKIVHVDIL